MGVGIKCKFYRNASATASTAWATPTWDEVPILGDVTLDLSPQFTAQGTRESMVERGLVVGYKVSVSGNVRVVPGNADYAAMLAAATAGSPVDCLVLNAAKERFGAAGVRAKFLITKWSEDQKLGALVFKDFELMPYMSDVADETPKAAEVTGSAEAPTLTYTEFGTAV